MTIKIEAAIADAIKAIVSTKAAAENMNAADIVELTMSLVATLVTPNIPAISVTCNDDVEKAADIEIGAVKAEVKAKPAVPVEESVKDDYIVCLEDGKRFKMMKRHLRETYGMSPDEYRNKWNLPSNYPMSAPSFSRAKAQTAKKVGLGTYDRNAI